jgi:hypothetical protein
MTTAAGPLIPTAASIATTALAPAAPTLILEVKAYAFASGEINML